MKSLECEYGKIEYKLPNIPEAFELLGLMGINSEMAKKSKELQENDILYTARLIKNIGFLVGKIDIKIGETKIKKYEDLLSHFEVAPQLIKIAEEIMLSIDLEGKKKQQ